MNPSKEKFILAIETSCDETAAAVLKFNPLLSPPLTRGGRKAGWPKIQTLSSVVKSQIKLHSKFGGVVPEIAARAHVKYIRPVVEQSLKAISYKLEAIDFIAVTAGPGLLPSLMVGVEFAKGLSFALKKPVLPVNHLLGHLYSPLGKIRDEGLRIKDLFPMISLIVSGGHTILVLLKDAEQYKILGQTLDDAAGEAFDKVAKLLKLPYPGGPEVSRLADRGNPSAINFPRPMMHHKNYNFSFSGLKTAVLYYLKNHPLPRGTPKIASRFLGKPLPTLPPGGGGIKGEGDKDRKISKQDICASFQQAAVDVLAAKTLRAAREFKAKSISLSGGVAANKNLRESLKLKAKSLKLNFFAPPQKLCTDNAEMIGLAAVFMLRRGFKPKSYKSVQTNANLEL